MTTSRHHRNHTGSTSTLKQLLGQGSKNHHPAFDKVLPRQMAKLVADGLFVRDENAEGGYRITEFGLKVLKEKTNGP